MPAVPPPDPLPSPRLAEVARAAGVSQMTVSRALNGRPGVSEGKRAEIRRIAEELGYLGNPAARKLSGGSSRVVGVITPRLDLPFVAEVLAGAGQAAHAAGYEVLVYSLSEAGRRPPGGVTRLLEQLADGVIALLPHEYRYLRALSAARVPIVTVDHGAERARLPTVAADSYAGGCAAVSHLLALGHRRIALVAGDERLASARDRRRAWADTLVRSGLRPQARLIAAGEYSQEGGFQAATRLLRLRPRPTALFAANDHSAMGALAAAHAAGLRVPEDVSVVGFDDVPFAGHLRPALTTVRQPLREMGRAAMEALLSSMTDAAAAPRQVVLPTELVVRESTGPARR